MKAALALVCTLLIGIGIGYYVTPTKTKVEVRTVEVEKKKTDKVVVRVKERRPDGSSTTTTTVTDKSVTTKNTDNFRMEQSKQKDWLFSISIHTDGAYGAHAQRRILGPIWLGGAVTTRGAGSITVGVSF